MFIIYIIIISQTDDQKPLDLAPFKGLRALQGLEWQGKEIADGVVHKAPVDLRKALTSAPGALAAWKDITPLARNEWICWTISVKNPETRKSHIERTITELKEGKRRPCCCAGNPRCRFVGEQAMEALVYKYQLLAGPAFGNGSNTCGLAMNY